MKNLYFFLSFICFVSVNGQIIFQRSYGTNPDRGYSLIQTPDSGYLVGAYRSSDLWLLKTDKTGDTLISRLYGGTSSEFPHNASRTSDGGYIISGNTNSFGTTYGDHYLVKTDAVGTVSWSKVYSNTCIWAGYAGVRQTLNGGYILTGIKQQFCTQGNFFFYLAKTNSSGTVQWSKNFNLGYRNLELTADSGFILSGCPVIKLDKNGDTLWVRNYGSYCSNMIRQTSDGGYIMIGYSGSPSDVLAIKTDVNGNVLWSKSYGGIKDEAGIDVRQTSDGGYILGGMTKSFPGDSTDIYLIKTNTIGDTVWTKVYGDIFADELFSVIQPSDGGYCIGANSGYSTLMNDANVRLIKTDPLGNSLTCNKKNIITTVSNLPVIATPSPISYSVNTISDSPVTSLTANTNPTLANGCVVLGIPSWGKNTEHTIYPNPTHSKVIIEGGSKIGLICLYDSHGQKILEQSGQTISQVLDLGDLSAGIYFLSVDGYFSKIIKD